MNHDDKLGALPQKKSDGFATNGGPPRGWQDFRRDMSRVRDAQTRRDRIPGIGHRKPGR